MFRALGRLMLVWDFWCRASGDQRRADQDTVGIVACGCWREAVGVRTKWEEIRWRPTCNATQNVVSGREASHGARQRERTVGRAIIKRKPAAEKAQQDLNEAGSRSGWSER